MPQIVYPVNVPDKLRWTDTFGQVGTGDLEGDDVVCLARGASIGGTRSSGSVFGPFG